MDWSEILLTIVPAVATFLIGLFRNKPGYTKAKALNGAIAKALEDDKITRAELEEILNSVK